MKGDEITIIKHGTVVTMDERRRVLENGAVVIQGDKIKTVGKTSDIEKKHKGDIKIDAKGKLVLPGLISTHHHSAVFEHGLGEGFTPEEYLDKLYYPVIGVLFEKPEYVYVDSLLSYVEAIKTGTTCVNDMYIKMDQCGRAAEDIGIRAVLSSTGGDGGEGVLPSSPWVLESVEDNEKLLLDKNGAANGRVTVCFGVEYVPLCSPEFIMKVVEKAKKYNVGIHIHLNESLDEVESSKKRFKKPSVEHVYDLGALGPKTVGVHCVVLSQKEIKLLKETGTHVAHCPVANTKYPGGVAPITELIDEGVNIGLGPDDMTCNDNLDMFGVMKLASLLQRVSKLDATLLPSKQVFEMATINGSKALGMDRVIGSIESGKKGDIIIMNMRTPRFTPTLITEKYSNLYQNIVFSANGGDVESVIIDGQLVMDHRKIITIDEVKLIDRGTKVAREVLAEALE